MYIWHFGYDIFCTDGSQGNYALQDEYCEYVYGCTDNGLSQNHAGVVNDIDGDGLPAFNYNANAVIDDGSCEPVVSWLCDNSYLEYDALLMWIQLLLVLLYSKGCTMLMHLILMLYANQDDDSCIDYYWMFGW